MSIHHSPQCWLSRNDTARASGGSLLLLLLACVPLAVGVVRVRAAAPATSNYDLTVIVFAAEPVRTEVAASYSQTVDHAALEAGINALSGELSVHVSGLSIGDAPLVRDSSVPSTAVQFRAPGLVTSGQALPLAAILHAFPGWKHARVAFVVGSGFAFVGPPDGTGVGSATARLVGAGSSYEYDVEQGKQGTASARLAPPSPGAERPAAPAREAPPAGGRMLWLSGTLVVAAAAVAAWIIFRPSRRGK